MLEVAFERKWQKLRASFAVRRALYNGFMTRFAKSDDTHDTMMVIIFLEEKI